MSDPAAELAFQNEIIAHLTAHGWLLGNTADYDRQRALYPEDVIGLREGHPTRGMGEIHQTPPASHGGSPPGPRGTPTGKGGHQVRNNTAEQAMLGDFPKAVEEAVLASGDAHQELMTQFLANKTVQKGFARLLLEILAKSA